MPRRLPKFCVEDRDRYGTIRIYLRRPGLPKVRIEGTPWTPEFMAAYERALDAAPATPALGAGKPTAGTWRWLCVEYFARSADFLRLNASTRIARRKILEATFEEPIAPGSKLLFGDIPLAKMTAKAVRVLRDRKIDTPEMGNARVKAARAVFRWGMVDELVTVNPAQAVAYWKSGTEGHHSWTIDEVRAFEARHPLGTTPRLAMALLLYTGVRRSDVVLLGRQHVTAGWLKFTQTKNRARKPIVVEIPVLPALQAVIDASPTGNLTYLVTHHDKPYSATGFSNRFRNWCDEAGLPHCSAHGLRKAGATIAAENGATEHQLMAIFGWVEPKQAAKYTREANRKRMAGAGIGLIDMGRKPDGGRA